METWAIIPEFPDYAVSDYGWVRNNETEQTLALSKNQHGVLHVGLYKDRQQYRRSVTVLVANAFLEPPDRETFDTPIQLDGDVYNTAAQNLAWRPRWFARKYKQQFRFEIQHDHPLVEINTGEEFDSYWAAAIKYGLLVRDIRVAMLNHTYVFPTFQVFAKIPTRYQHA
jgi:hypothetical protein